jgi:hypothetical protein
MTDECMYRLAMLLPPELRGVYSDLSAATTRFLSFDRPQPKEERLQQAAI